MTIAKMLSYSIIGFSVIVSSPSGAAHKSRAVKYSDLDLAKDKDVKTLQRRIDRAIARMCGSVEMANSSYQLEQIEKCTRAAQTDASQKIASARSQHRVRVSVSVPNWTAD